MHGSRHGKPSDSQWLSQILSLLLQIRIGRHGSCAEIGVMAVDDISRGECLAVIPRRERWILQLNVCNSCNGGFTS